MREEIAAVEKVTGINHLENKEEFTGVQHGAAEGNKAMFTDKRFGVCQFLGGRGPVIE